MRLRLLMALVIVTAGMFFISPSFNPDSDHDGVHDAREISLGTDPATADHFGDWTAGRS